MASEKPTLVFIPGAWHTAEYYEGVIAQLKGHGYEVHALRLPSVGGDETTTVADDAAHIQKTTSALAAEGKEIILVMHSYGGIPGTESAKGLLQKDRAAEGQKGGIIGLVYLTAFLLPEGLSMWQFLGGMPDWVVYNGKRMGLARTPEVMYNDLPAEEAESWSSKTLYHAAPTFETPLTYPAYKYVPVTYLQCEKDQAIPFAGQQAMAKIPGDHVKTPVCGASHSPMLSMPETVVKVIREAAGETVA